jgi:hypothetical protein
MEHILGRLRDSQLQEINQRKRANRARKRREKRRWKKSALADGIQGGASKKGPVLVISEAPEDHQFVETWVPPVESPAVAEAAGSDSEQGAGRMNPPSEEEPDTDESVSLREDLRSRDARRMIRGAKNIACDMLREGSIVQGLVD